MSRAWRKSRRRGTGGVSARRTSRPARRRGRSRPPCRPRSGGARRSGRRGSAASSGARRRADPSRSASDRRRARTPTGSAACGRRRAPCSTIASRSGGRRGSSVASGTSGAAAAGAPERARARCREHVVQDRAERVDVGARDRRGARRPARATCTRACRARRRPRCHRGRAAAFARGRRLGDAASGSFSAAPARRSLARPQSRTIVSPNAPTRMLLGLRSRWTMPWSCAYATASAAVMTCGSSASRSARVSASRIDARQRLPEHELHHEERLAARPEAGVVDGHDAGVLQARRRGGPRARSASRARRRAVRSILMATGRWRRRSRAAKTRPMPPLPISRSRA